MTVTRRLILAGGAAALAGCSTSKFKRYNGPEVTRIHVYKGARIMQLMHNQRVLKSYEFELGFAPTGHKQVEGDGKTPEGAYYINRRNPNSRYHLSIGISYPDADDVAAARALGENPGGEIFIHGTPTNIFGTDDWTAGCIAVSNDEIEEIYSMVNDGTIIVLLP